VTAKCICGRHAVSQNCPKHGEYLDVFRTIHGVDKPTIFDDPEWKKADEERWNRRREQEAAR
jgi:hypothetical protein